MNNEAREVVYWMLVGSVLTCGIASVVGPDETRPALLYANGFLTATFLVLLLGGWFR